MSPNLIYHGDFIGVTSERLLRTGLHSKMKQFNISGSLVNAEEKEQASESGKPRPDFNSKAKFVLTMLNFTIYKHMWCRTAEPRTTVERELESFYCMLLFKTPVCIPFKTFTEDIEMLVVSAKRIRIHLALNQGGGGGGGEREREKKQGMGPRNDVLTTYKAIR